MQSNHNLIYCTFCLVLWVIVLCVLYTIYDDQILGWIKGETVNEIECEYGFDLVDDKCVEICEEPEIYYKEKCTLFDSECPSQFFFSYEK